MRWILFLTACISYRLRIGSSVPTHGRHLTCYMEYWSIFNDFNTFEDVNAALDKCTHLVYMFGSIDENTFKMIATDQRRQVISGGFERSVAVKKIYPHLKVLLAVGGGDSDKTFSKMCSEKSFRDTFTQSAVEFLERFSFDGMELRWRGLGETSTEDGKNLVLLSKDLKPVFDEHGLLYTVAVSKRKDWIDAGPDPKELSQNAHYLIVLSTAYRGFYDGTVNPYSALYSDDTFNVNFTIQYYLQKGVDPGKLNLGISSFFATFQTTEPVPSGNEIVGLPTKMSVSYQGPNTADLGNIAYYELCQEMEGHAEKWAYVVDSKTKLPFAVKDSSDYVVSVETEQTYAEKVKYAMQNKLGGVAYYSLDSDDFRPYCKSSKEPYPLLASVDRALHKYSHLIYNDIKQLTKIVGSVFFWRGMQY